jgi:hypothetical protein
MAQAQPITVDIVPAPQVLGVELRAGRMSLPAFTFFQNLVNALLAIIPSVSAAFGSATATLATMPTLTAAQAGTVVAVVDFGHFVVWTGSVWQFAPGDAGNAYYVQFAVAPTAPGWHAADGSATSYLTVGGATLTATPFVTAIIAGAYFRR